MNKCCENQTTPFCGTCGASLKEESLLGIKEYCVGRLSHAQKLLDERKGTATLKGDAQAAKKLLQDVARSETAVKKWTRRVELLKAAIARDDAPVAPNG